MTGMGLKDDRLTSRDRDLERRVLNYLVDRGVPALRNICVEADNGRVTLRGRLQSYYQKQLCLSCCRRVAGVVSLVDETLVLPLSPQQPSELLDWSSDREEVAGGVLATV